MVASLREHCEFQEGQILRIPEASPVTCLSLIAENWKGINIELLPTQHKNLKI